jgi:ActR/RegA family two-component response regulator
MQEFVVLVDDEEEFVSTLAERLELRGLRATANRGGSDHPIEAPNRRGGCEDAGD